MLNLKSYGTTKGLIISGDHPYHVNFQKYRFNKMDMELIKMNSGWYLLPDVKSIDDIDHWCDGYERIDHWLLIDPSLESAAIPAKLLESEVNTYVNDDSDQYEWEFRNNIRPLYNPVRVKVDGYYRDVEFEVRHIGDILGDIDNPVTTKFRVKDTGWSDTRREVIISSLATYSEIDSILVPEFALHMKPCQLSTDATYKIIRTYILDNIDPMYARVTSDYDFCMTVQKIIKVRPKNESLEYDSMPNHKRPKIENKKHKDIMVDIYRASPKAYQSYPVVRAFEGDTLQDLVNNINIFLKELIEEINKPKYACECCEGLGYTV